MLFFIKLKYNMHKELSMLFYF